MDGLCNDIHGFSPNIDGDYGQAHERNHLPYSRPLNQSRLTSHMFESTRPASTQLYQEQHRLHRLQPQYLHQGPESLEPYYNDGQYSEVLDDYDRALLAEPQSQLQGTSIDRIGTIAQGRLSLPGHTAPYTPTPIFEPAARQQRHRINAGQSSQDFKSKISQYVHTPPGQVVANSSPVPALPSSPLFNASQRRPRRPKSLQLSSVDQFPGPQPITTPNPKNTRANGLPRNGSDDTAIEKTASLATYSSPPVQTQISLRHTPPIIQGIQLVSTNDLPDRFRAIFPFNPFNAIQSKCYYTAYQSNDNLVVSAPTGGGKTAIFELAICHLMSGFENDQYKIVYMAPTKSLCSERQRDWQAKFAALNLVCAELTGDTDYAHLRSVQSASIIITTPEKWDSMTRQWKDHAKLMQLVKLFLIDEVHMLRDARGATLEAVVSRMKSVGSSVRFVALSATVPNSEDVATWLGKDHATQHLPAVREVFGDSFRPVKLQKHIFGIPYKGNDYGFDGVCNLRLPDIIAKYGCKKPLMIFCVTRKSAQSTAKLLANDWASKDPRERQWQGPVQRIAVSDPELTKTLPSAVAFHHAGLDGSDRHAVEKGFLTGSINVICCTSTLAVGINLPCHLVVIKNTMGYQSGGLKEYADLEIMQMLGRAGRPQFDDSAVAVIITKQEKVKKYENLVTGSELLESCLHLNLIDHLNAEIGLGTVDDLHTAKRWLGGTFLYVRLRKNPEHYKLNEDTASEELDETIETICRRDLELLENAGLISTDIKIKATEMGHIMARYYVQFKTMEILLGLGPRSKISDILSSLVQAEEYHEIRLKAFEKKLLKYINSNNGIKFPIKVDLAMHAHKRSLLIQAELGGVDFPVDEQYAKHKRTFQTEKGIAFSNSHRLIRCVVDIQVHLQDAVGTRHALELARSLSAGVWDTSPFQMKQIPQIGPVAIRKLALGGIVSIEALEAAEPHRIELLLSKNPPFGSKLIAHLKDFPKLRVSIKKMDKGLKNGRAVFVKLKLECGFINDKVPVYFNRKPVYVCLLTERSDGYLVDFRRISARKLNNGQDVLISAEMTSHTQHIICYVMCEEIAGTMRYAELKPGLPAYLFTATPSRPRQHERRAIDLARPVNLMDDEFGADEIDDQDMVDAAKDRDFKDIDKIMPVGHFKSPELRPGNQSGDPQGLWNAEKLENGKWACNHKCKDKTACKHLCCREGLDKAPKAPRNSFVPASTLVDSSKIHPKSLEAQSKLDSCLTTKPPYSSGKDAIKCINLANEEESLVTLKKAPRHMRGLEKLHQSVTKGVLTPTILQKKPSYDFSKDGQRQPFSFLNSDNPASSGVKQSIDYSDEWLDDFPSPSELLTEPKQDTAGEYFSDRFRDPTTSADSINRKTYDTNSSEEINLSQSNNDQYDIEAAMMGSSDSISPQGQPGPDGSIPSNSWESRNVGLLTMMPTTTTRSTQFPLPSACIIQPHANLVLDPNKIFRSKDGPRKVLPTIIPDKRSSEDPADYMPETRDSPTEHNSITMESKRQKKTQSIVNDNDDEEQVDELAAPSLFFSSSTDPPPQQKPAIPVLKPGHPAWVYDFDPAFIAEYEDIVDFV